MKILITGGSGFIGKNIKEQLSSSYEIKAPPHDELDLLDFGSVQSYLKKNSFDVILHTAVWNSSRNIKRDPTCGLHNDLRMYHNLIHCENCFGKMIHFGSGAIYGREHWIPKMKEEQFGLHIPKDDYGFAKFLISKDILSRKNVIDFRIFAVYGKYEDWEVRFISNAICKTLYKIPITLRQDAFYDYVFIDDLVRITRWFIDNPVLKDQFNICTGNPVSLFECAQTIIRLSNIPNAINVKQAGLGTEYSGNNSRLLGTIKGFNFSNHETNINSLIEWYQSRLSTIPKDLLLVDK